MSVAVELFLPSTPEQGTLHWGHPELAKAIDGALRRKEFDRADMREIVLTLNGIEGVYMAAGLTKEEWDERVEWLKEHADEAIQ